MPGNIRTFRWFAFIFLMFLLSSVIAIPGSFGVVDNPGLIKHPGIVLPDSRPGGHSYPEWSAKWWQWAYSMPIDANPLFDTASGSAGQSGNVWFIGAKINTERQKSGNVDRVYRNLTIPLGTMLFFPIINVEGSEAEGNGGIELDLKNYASGFLSNIEVMFADIDGVPVKNLTQYRATSHLFKFGPLPDNNVLQYWRSQDYNIPDAPAGTITISVADGYYLMLEPLPIGIHTIHFGGTVNDSGYLGEQETTYQITVKGK
jgi:hypothetical protein